MLPERAHFISHSTNDDYLYLRSQRKNSKKKKMLTRCVYVFCSRKLLIIFPGLEFTEWLKWGTGGIFNRSNSGGTLPFLTPLEKRTNVFLHHHHHHHRVENFFIILRHFFNFEIINSRKKKFVIVGFNSIAMLTNTSRTITSVIDCDNVVVWKGRGRRGAWGG